MKVRIIQCLCPNRHCILAVTYATNTGKCIPEFADTFRQSVDKLIAQKQITPTCAICGSASTEFTYEDAPTKFKTMEEARPEMERLEEQQRLSREMHLMLKRHRN